ncbi:hypothetical protein [Saccharothrix sp.]|uniref:hypothetical protein n=1 Tax=Saccharothrix sp. TaxID=1873460 RepID=UPI00281221A6|nr:hypothetical protein [Saccharothrix sp.]
MSAQTAVVAALVAVVLGTWLALGTARAPAAVRRVLDGAAHLPLAVPSVVVGLGLALSMGEVGATNMLYPPDWRTLPVSVFALTDRGQVFAASASTVVLLGSRWRGWWRWGRCGFGRLSGSCWAVVAGWAWCPCWGVVVPVGRARER